MAEFSELGELVKALADILGVAHYVDSDLPILYRLSSALNRYWQDSVKTEKIPQGVILLIDFDKKPEWSLFQQLTNELLPTTYESLKSLRSFSEGRNFRVIIAGRHLASTPETQTYTIPLSSPYLLEPFSFKVIRDSVKQYLTDRYQDDEVLQVAAHVFHLTGGHPRCIAKTVEMYSDSGLPIEVFLDFRKPEITEIVHTTVAEVINELPERYFYLHDERNILRHLSVYRYVDTSILGENIQKRDITEVKDEYGLWDELGSTYLFRPDAGLIRDDIVRRLLAIQWRDECPNEFSEACRHAQDVCAGRILESPRQPEQWAIEYLFQSLQQHNPYINGDKRDCIAKEFFEVVVPDMLSNYARIAYPESMRGKRDLLLDRLTRTMKPEYDWEFEYMVNYTLRVSQYTDEPYQKLIAQIQDYF